MSVRVSSSDQPKGKYMNILQLCAQLLQQGEIIRLRCNQVKGGLSAIFALQENNLEKLKDLQQLYYDCLEQTTQDVAAGKAIMQEADETLQLLKSKVATRPIPLVRM